MHQSLTVLVLKHHNFPYQKYNRQDVIAAYGWQGIHVSAVTAAGNTLQMPPLLCVPLKHHPATALKFFTHHQRFWRDHPGLRDPVQQDHCIAGNGKGEMRAGEERLSAVLGRDLTLVLVGLMLHVQEWKMLFSHPLGNYNLYQLFCSSLENFKWLTSFGTAVLTYPGTWFPNTL